MLCDMGYSRTLGCLFPHISAFLSSDSISSRFLHINCFEPIYGLSLLIMMCFFEDWINRQDSQNGTREGCGYLLFLTLDSLVLECITCIIRLWVPDKYSSQAFSHTQDIFNEIQKQRIQLDYEAMQKKLNNDLRLSSGFENMILNIPATSISWITTSLETFRLLKIFNLLLLGPTPSIPKRNKNPSNTSNMNSLALYTTLPSPSILRVYILLTLSRPKINSKLSLSIETPYGA